MYQKIRWDIENHDSTDRWEAATLGTMQDAGATEGSAREGDGLRRLVLVASGVVVALPFVAPPVALALGAFIGLCVGNPDAERTQRLSPKLLAASVVGLGAGVNLADVASVGAHGALLTLGTVAACLALGALGARLLRVEPQVAILVAVGTAICGGTAIAAMIPIVRARRDQATVALGTVFVLNAVAMVLLPVVGRALRLDADSFGTLAALAVHDTSAVIGAAASFGERAVEIATTVKLARATFLVPVALGVAVLRRPAAAGERAGTLPIPWFILGFLAASALVTFVPALASVGDAVAALARRAMVVSLFLVGAGASRSMVAASGLRPLALGVALWLAVAGLALALVA